MPGNSIPFPASRTVANGIKLPGKVHGHRTASKAERYPSADSRPSACYFPAPSATHALLGKLVRKGITPFGKRALAIMRVHPDEAQIEAGMICRELGDIMDIGLGTEVVAF